MLTLTITRTLAILLHPLIGSVTTISYSVSNNGLTVGVGVAPPSSIDVTSPVTTVQLYDPNEVPLPSSVISPPWQTSCVPPDSANTPSVIVIACSNSATQPVVESVTCKETVYTPGSPVQLYITAAASSAPPLISTSPVTVHTYVAPTNAGVA